MQFGKEIQWTTTIENTNKHLYKTYKTKNNQFEPINDLYIHIYTYVCTYA